MSDVIEDPVVEPEVKEEVSAKAEETSPKPDVDAAPQEPGEVKKHPLEPGGDRFNQVWARSKKAEAEAKALQAELQREREERIRLEERTRVREEQAQQKEMTWAQLEEGINEGKWTRDQAQEYKDRMTEQRLERKLKERERQVTSDSKILGELEQYKATIPDLMTYGSESRSKYEKELAFMVRDLGMPDNYATQLAAARAAFGDLDTVKARRSAKETITTKDSFMETHTPQRQPSSSKSFKDTLSPWQQEQYEKLIKAKVYSGWKEVEDEQKWTPKAINQGRR